MGARATKIRVVTRAPKSKAKTNLRLVHPAPKSASQKSKKAVRLAPVPKKATPRRAPLPAKKASPKRALPLPKKAPSKRSSTRALLPTTPLRKVSSPRKKAAQGTTAPLAPIAHAHELAPRRASAPLPLPSMSASNAKQLLPWAALLGLGALFLLSKKSSGVVQTLPAPAPPPRDIPAKPPFVAPPIAPVPPAPELPKGTTYLEGNWTSNHKVLNSLPGYHRAKQAETTGEMTAASSAAVNDIKTKYGNLVHHVSEKGVPFAVAIEEHFHEPGGPVKPWGPHKGGSIFIKNT